jgi:hypothetical protein
MKKLVLADLAALFLTGFAVPRGEAVLLSLGLQEAGVNGGAINTVATDASSPANLSFTSHVVADQPLHRSVI